MNLERDLFCVAVVSNPVRYKRRYELYNQFCEAVEAAGVNLVRVEQGFGQRDFAVTDSSNPWHLQLRSVDELWVKENLINLGIEHGMKVLPTAKMAAWVDADCHPAMPMRKWFEETWHQLQVYEFVQMWENIIDLDINYNPVARPSPSFMSNYLKYGTPYPKGIGAPDDEIERMRDTVYGPISWGSPGLAWAANLEAYSKIGGLPDGGVCGAGDWYLAHMLISNLDIPKMSAYTDGYRNYWKRIQQKCERWIMRDVGVVSGLVYHYWHGKKVNRKYNTREQILIENEYDPATDIKYDIHGQLMLETYEPRQIKMRDQLRQYFRERNEDDIAVR
jgi:hypothetical protein